MKCVFSLFLLTVGLHGLKAGQILEKRPEIYSLHVVSDIKYRFATTKVTSRVKNSGERSREAIFDVTLPNEAFITNLTLEIDGKIIVGEIKEKEIARAQYDAARRRGESAGYIGTKHRETNKFNLAITVAPLSKVSFNLTYQELLKRKHGFYEQVIYIDPGQPVQDMHVTVAILETREITDLVVPPLRNDIFVDLTGTGEMSSVIIQQPADNKAYIKYFPSVEEQIATSESGISGQFVVKYDVDREMDAGDLMVVNGYFVHFFAPEGFNPIPKDVLFVLDKSGSMHGTKITQLKQAMVSVLDELNEGDRINIMTFSSSTSFWQTEMVEVTGPEVIEEAKVHVNSINPGGWTNIEGAVTRGLGELTSRDKDLTDVRSTVIVFLTDGEPTKGITDKDMILESVRETNVERIPIFSLAFGEGADYDLVKKLSAQNSGFARKIYEASDADKQISGFYKEISVTLLNNVNFTYLDAPVSNVTETKYPYYFNGSEVIIAGRMVTAELQGGLVLRSEIEANSVEGVQILQTNAPIDESGFSYMNNMTGIGDYEEITEKVWAYLTIKELLKKALATEDEDLKEGYNRKVLELSLRYGFVTPLTSMVVTKPEDKAEVDEVEYFEEIEDDEPAIALPSYDTANTPILMGRTGGGPAINMHSQVANSPPRPAFRRRYNSDLLLNMDTSFYDDPLLTSGYRAPPPPGRRPGLSRPTNMSPGSIGSKIGGSNKGSANKKMNKRRRKDRKRQRKQKRKQLKKMVDFPMKVKFSDIDEPLCYGLYNQQQFQNDTETSYLLYRDPLTGTKITVDTTMEVVTRWRKVALIKTVTIETANMTELITRDSLQNKTFITRELAGLEITVQGSARFEDGLTVFFDGITENQSVSRDGILAKLLSKKFSLKKVVTIQSKKGKRKRPETPLKRGIFKVKGENKFVGVMMTLPDQAFAGVGSTCWDVQKHETKFFDMNEFSITN